MPNIEIKDSFDHEKYGEALVGCCPVNVFKMKKNKVKVVNARDCTTCRQCVTVEGVELGKVKD